MSDSAIFFYEICSKEISKEFHEYLLNINNPKKFYFRYFVRDFLDNSEILCLPEDIYYKYKNKNIRDIFIKMVYREKFQNDEKQYDDLVYEHYFKVNTIFENIFLLPNVLKLITLYSFLAEHVDIRFPNSNFFIESRSVIKYNFINQPMSFYRHSEEVVQSFDDKVCIMYSTNLCINTKQNFLYKWLIQKYNNKLNRKFNMILIEKNQICNISKSVLKDGQKTILNDSFKHFDKKSLFQVEYKIPCVNIYDNNTEIFLEFENSKEIFINKNLLKEFLINNPKNPDKVFYEIKNVKESLIG